MITYVQYNLGSIIFAVSEVLGWACGRKFRLSQEKRGYILESVGKYCFATGH